MGIGYKSCTQPVGEGGRMWAVIVPLLDKESQEHTKPRHKLAQVHKVGAVVSPYLKNAKTYVPNQMRGTPIR
jgi:hypothetical protein